MTKKLDEIFSANIHSFAQEIQTLVGHGHTYLEALTEYAENHSLDIETLSSIVKKNRPILENLMAECHEKSLLKGGKESNIKPFLKSNTIK